MEKKQFNFSFSPLKPTFFSLLFSLILLAACEKDEIPTDNLQTADAKASVSAEKTNNFYGPAQPIGNGVARAMVTLTKDGVPEAIAVKLSEKALDRLPSGEPEYAYTLDFHQKADGLLFDHVDLGWNPEGHEPPGIYDVPHFDIHFYMTTEEEQMAITASEESAAKAEILPDMMYWPESYFPTPGYVPTMGKHWLSSNAEELQPGGVFSQTFIYGSYDGEFTFYEPMITKAYLEEKGSMQYDIPQPDHFQHSGYLPTTYSISYDSTKKEYTISLEGMVWRDAE